MRSAIYIAAVLAMTAPVLAQQKPAPVVANAAPAAQNVSPDGLQATQLLCLVTDEGQAIVLQKAPDGVKAKPVFVKPPPAFDPYKQKLLKYNDKADGARCVREPVLADMNEKEQADFLKAQFDQWFGPAAALLLDQQNQIRELQKQPPITMDQLMDQVAKLPRK